MKFKVHHTLDLSVFPYVSLMFTLLKKKNSNSNGKSDF